MFIVMTNNYNEQSAVFSLRTTDIRPFIGTDVATTFSEVYTSPIGSITGFGTDVIFNLNLEEIVGYEAFRKHKYFHLTMSNFQTIPWSQNRGTTDWSWPMANNVNLNYTLLDVWLSRPSFRLSTYNVVTQNNEQFAHLGIIGREQNRVITSGVTSGGGNWRNDEYLYRSVATYPNRDIIIEKQKNISFRITFSPTNSTLKTIPNTVFPNGVQNSMQHFVAKFSLTPVK